MRFCTARPLAPAPWGENGAFYLIEQLARGYVEPMPTCPTCGQPIEPPPGAIIITDAILPQVKDLPSRPGPVKALVYHTTGRGLAKVAAKGGAPGTAAYDEAAIAWYRRSRHAYYGAVLVGPSGLAYRLAPDGVKAWHAASLTPEQAAGRVKVPAWWAERWAPLPGPHALIGRSINALAIGVDALPLPDGTFSPAQLDTLAAVGRQLAAAHGLTLERIHHLGHEDVDPWRRGVTSTGVERPWDPGWDWSDFMARLQAA